MIKAPTITIEHIHNLIVKEDYHLFEDTTVTICLLTLDNGFTVTGESACVCHENFDKLKGQEIAKENAINKIWQLDGYL